MINTLLYRILLAIPTMLGVAVICSCWCRSPRATRWCR